MEVSYTACFPTVTTDPMRIALFSEVYWPMVSGVGVTLRRLADYLTARGHAVRVYSADYALPPGGRDRAEVHRSPSVPLFLYPDVHWAFPRFGAVLEDARRFQPDVVHVATEFALGLTGLRVARRLDVPVVASAHTNYDQYAGRYGMDWLRMPGWQIGTERAVRVLVYALLLVMAASGIATLALSHAAGVLFFGAPLPLPNFWRFPPMNAHFIAAIALLALAALHIAAALYHQFYRRDRLLARMGLG